MPNNKKKKPDLADTVKQYQDQILKGFAVFGIMGLLGGGYLVHKTSEIKEQTAVESRKNVQKNKALIAKLRKLEHTKPITEEQGTENLQNAVKAGTKLANLQNQYQTTGTSAKKIAKVVRGIRPLLLSDSDDPSPWFETGNKKKPSKWIFVSKFTFTQESVNVVFENVNPDGDIYAYTIATYNPLQYKFTDFKTTVTVLGENATHSTGNQKNTVKKAQQDQINAIKKVIGKEKGYKMPSKKERQQMQKGAEKMQEKNEKKYGLDSDLPDDMKQRLKHGQH